MLEQLLPADTFTIFLVFCRVGGAIMLLPGFGEVFVPARVRLMIALAITLVLTPLVAPSLPCSPDWLAVASALIGPVLCAGSRGSRCV